MSKYHSQDQICHLFVEQSPDCTSADLRSGNLTFNGPTLVSFGHWTLAHWTGRFDAQGKRLLLRNREIYGRSGWNSDGHQQNILGRALHGRTDYVEISVKHDQLKRYVATVERAARIESGWHSEDVGDKVEAQRLRDEAWRVLGEELVHEEIANLMAKAQRYAKPSVYAYFSSELPEAGVGSTQECQRRISDLSTEAIIDRTAQFSIPFMTFEQDLEDAREIVRQGYAKYNDPKKVKARLSSGRRSGIIRLRKMVHDMLGMHHHYRYRGPHLMSGYHYYGSIGPDAAARAVIDAAFETYPDEALTLIGKVAEYLAESEAAVKFRVMHPNAAAVLEKRQNFSQAKYISPDEWMAGKQGEIRDQYGYGGARTYLRKDGNRVVTSRGAEVPLKDAVRLYQLAAHFKTEGMELTASVNGTRVGHFQLDRIDANGDCHIGCHHLDFVLMEQLACKVVPHLVKARHPLPMVIRG